MYVRVRAYTCTQNCSDQTKEHTHILSGTLLTARPRAHKIAHTHTPSLITHSLSHILSLSLSLALCVCLKGQSALGFMDLVSEFSSGSQTYTEVCVHLFICTLYTGQTL